MFWKKKKKLVTHSGSFHADDVFACAMIQMLLERRGERYAVTRTRDEKLIAGADFVFDVGGVYDPAQNRFDHHQVGGAGKRPNGIPYAAAGLVWKTYGQELAGATETQEHIDQKIIQPIDANDNGVTIYKVIDEVVPYTLQSILYADRPTWKEDSAQNDRVFKKHVAWAKSILAREITVAQHNAEAVALVERAYDEAQDKRIIILESNYPFQETLQQYPEPLFVISQKSDSTDWRVVAVRADVKTFENRQDLPQSWAGKRDAELAEVTGVPDAVFCHNARWLVVAKTREGAIELAKKAIETITN